MRGLLNTISLLSVITGSVAEDPHLQVANRLKKKGLAELGAFDFLNQLSGGIGPRLSGSENAEKAVTWGRSTMLNLGFSNVRLLPCMVPHWVRGENESVQAVLPSGDRVGLTGCALGASNSTNGDLVAPVIAVQSLKEATQLGAKLKGKFVFFNRPFDSSLVNTFAAYGAAGDQRFAGPALAAKLGAVGALNRSLTSDPDDVPHTGVTEFPDKGPKVPCMALSIVASNRLTELLKQYPELKLRMHLECATLPDISSADVIGEIRGAEKPNEVVVMGGHLDSWDKGRGAHDDGAGVCHALEALRLIHELGLKPKRTLRVVLWMDEENRGSGAAAYYQYAKAGLEKHVGAIESDSGGFAPRSFGSSLSSEELRRLDPWAPAFRELEVDHIIPHGETGADVGPLGDLKTPLFGLIPESQRYFDYHHSDKDTIDKVNPRELELGAISVALLAWALAN